MNKRNFFIRFSAFHGKIRIFGKIRRAVPPSRFSAQQSAMQARQDHIRVPKLGVICGFGTAIGLSGASVTYPCAKTGTAAVRWQVRRLQPGRCGELWAKALFPPGCCPVQRRSAVAPRRESRPVWYSEVTVPISGPVTSF